MKELMGVSKTEGFQDNSWSKWGKCGDICEMQTLQVEEL